MALYETEGLFGKIREKRTHMSRFSAAPYAIVKHSESYAQHEFERTYICLELDFLGAPKLVKLLKAAHIHGEHVEHLDPTSSKSLDEQLIKATSSNACVVSYQMFSNATNKRYTLQFAELGRKMVKFHVYQNNETRDSDRMCSWHLFQINGGYMEHVCEIVGLLTDVESLQRASFAIDDSDVQRLGDDWQSEDAFASVYADSIFTLSAWRQRRNLDLLKGWWKRFG